ncbi:TonB-dependent receptor [Gluconacetobacter sp. 1b LMG 1731]|uniref:TonB-dependent receptor n=1 Tax=Gluconacetobacter dulcium TaxID=2729096 RepID=A0A7W4NT42_9PROT|nr:TonB-dependent receptor [Gluconacetobacter dulcium]MBB2165162.1 TonB-dependent receptor [Gluconacetobacter dulcium]MBB2194212.1 TonB-dependent receptor [Gluconacetobacter dulcium]
MRRSRRTLLYSAVFAAFGAPDGRADTGAAHARGHKATHRPATHPYAPAHPAPPETRPTAAAPTATRDPRPAVPEAILVSGRSGRTQEPGGGLIRVERSPKAIQTVTRDYIAKQAPTSNLQQMLRMLPSVNIADQDPFGLYAGQVNVRGFDQTEVGWLLDGAPLNDTGNAAFYANEAVEAEDLETVSLQPGSVDISSPVINASAGLSKATMMTPAAKFGGLIDASFGSYDTFRQYIRLNSGYLGQSGIRAMFAFSHTKGNLWRGSGQAEKDHYDFKAMKEFDNGSHTGLTVSYNDQINSNYLNPTLSRYRTTGYSTSFPAYFSGGNWYKSSNNPFRNVIAVVPTHIHITPRLSLDDSLYFWYGTGGGSGAMTVGSNAYMGTRPVTLDLGGASHALVLGSSNQRQFRPGNTLSVKYDADAHNSTVIGWWYEYDNEYMNYALGRMDQATGHVFDIWGRSDLITQTNGQPYNMRDFLTLTQTNMLFVEHHAHYFDDRLLVDLGFKEAMTTRRTYNYTPGARYNQNIHSAEPLPQLGVSWLFNPHHQIYISGTTSEKMPSNLSIVDFYNMAGVKTQSGGQSSPEYAIHEEIGYRYNDRLLVASLSFFNYNLTNRQQQLSYYLGTTPITTTTNAGGQTTRGVDAQIGLKPVWNHLRPYATVEYLHSTIDSDIRTAGMRDGRQVTDYLPTAGKIAVRSPKIQAGLGLDYDDGNFWVSGQIKYIGKQYATFMNDSSIPQYITNNIAIGYRLKSNGIIKSPEIQLNLQNLTGAKFRNGIYGISNALRTTQGVYGSTIAGSQPSYYLQPPFSAMVTVSAGF